MNTESFELRHIGIRNNDYETMLQTIGVESVNQLIFETVPNNIKLILNRGIYGNI